MTKASIFYGRKAPLFFPQRQMEARNCPGLFLRILIIYCIRYIEYAKVENALHLSILSEPVKRYFKKDSAQK
jgi:hypothetical protein